MTDIVERLRVNMHAYGIAQEAADEIERLRAERELLAQMMIRQSLSTGHGDTVADLVREMEPQVERLRAELAECKRDAMRYRWLRQFLLKADDTTFTFRPNVSEATPELFDSTIDAALKEKP